MHYYPALAISLCLALGLGLGAILLAWPESQSATVCSVHDGDTLTLCDGRKVRLWGIDAPELKQPGGEAAKQALTGLTTADRIVVDCLNKSYNRHVCRVTAKGHDVGASMVRQGWAWDAPGYSEGRYGWEQGQAIKEGLGVWPKPPWDWRKAR